MPNANYKFLLFEIIPVESNALSRPSPQRLLAHLEGFSRDSPQLRRHDSVNGFQVRVFLMTGCPNLRWKSSRRCRISRPAHLRWIGQRSLRTTCLTRSALVPVLLVDGFLSLGSSCTSSCPFLNLLCHSKVQGARHRLISVHQSAVVRVASDGVVSLLCSHCLTAQNLGTVNKSMLKKSIQWPQRAEIAVIYLLDMTTRWCKPLMPTAHIAYTAPYVLLLFWHYFYITYVNVN